MPGFTQVVITMDGGNKHIYVFDYDIAEDMG